MVSLSLLNVFLKESTFYVGLNIAVLLGVLSVLFLWHTKKRKRRLTSGEKAAILEQWTPEPLIDESLIDPLTLSEHLISGPVGKYVTVDGVECLNLASHNYLGLLEQENIKDSAIAAINKYGVGSCGPRGFYGTIDVHLELEERIAKFMEMEETILYSYGFATVSSAIPAYCKRNDVIFADEFVNFSIQKGLDAARSRVVFYKHNDMADLELRLEEQAALDKKNPKKASRTRRFLIAEGIYMTTGEICPLKELVELRKKYKLRLFLDESVSFGTIGSHGRGLSEHANVDRKEVDLICSSLENSVASIGGFCVGSTFIVEHQRLSGLGYCFSASAPPSLTRAAITALDLFENQPQMFQELNDVCVKLQSKLTNLSQFSVGGNELSPVKHLYLKNQCDDWKKESELLREFADECMKEKLAVVSAQYLHDVEKKCPRPSIRITANRLFTDEEIDFAVAILEKVSANTLSQ